MTNFLAKFAIFTLVYTLCSMLKVKFAHKDFQIYNTEEGVRNKYLICKLHLEYNYLTTLPKNYAFYYL